MKILIVNKNPTQNEYIHADVIIRYHSDEQEFCVLKNGVGNFTGVLPDHEISEFIVDPTRFDNRDEILPKNVDVYPSTIYRIDDGFEFVHIGNGMYEIATSCGIDNHVSHKWHYDNLQSLKSFTTKRPIFSDKKA
jgi:hypothetical protein